MLTYCAGTMFSSNKLNGNGTPNTQTCWTESDRCTSVLNHVSCWHLRASLTTASGSPTIPPSNKPILANQSHADPMPGRVTLPCFILIVVWKETKVGSDVLAHRVGLMGNPSDGFNGKTIAMSISNFWAEVTLVESQTLVKHTLLYTYL